MFGFKHKFQKDFTVKKFHLLILTAALLWSFAPGAGAVTTARADVGGLLGYHDHYYKADAGSFLSSHNPHYDKYADEYADEYDDDELVYDPLQGFNMVMYDFNHDLYYFAIKPATDVYRFVVPEEIRTCTSNFFTNLAFPVRFVNCLLQGKVDRAVDEFHAFFLNTTVGVLGLGDPASHIMGRSIPKEDFGQTLAVWGVDNGFYLVLPLLGPSTARNAVGSLGDMLMTPTAYLGLETELTLGASGLEIINTMSFSNDIYKQLEDISLDPYVALRNGYIQNNNKNIAE